MLFTLFVTLIIGLLIYFVYKRSHRGVMYNRSFNVSLVITSLVTSLIIMTITSNIALSLGMVGALSIVRFRAAVKETIDIVFMFWAISSGIACGAGLFQLAIVGSLFIALIMLLFSLDLRNPWHKEPYLLVLSYINPKIEGKIMELVKEKAGNFRIRSKTISPSHTELTLEVRLGQDNHNIVNDLMSVPGMSNALLVGYTDQNNR